MTTLRRNVAGQIVEVGPLLVSGSPVGSVTPYVNGTLGNGSATATEGGCWTYQFTQAETNTDLVRLRLVSGGGLAFAFTYNTEVRDSSGNVGQDFSTQLDAIQAKTDLIGTAGVAIGAPVTETGDIEQPVIIGDDYLNANGRAFVWDIDPVEGFTLGSITCWFGAKRASRQLWNLQGEATLVGNKWRLSFDLPKTTFANITPGEADWSVAIHEGDVEITKVLPDSTILNLVEKCT